MRRIFGAVLIGLGAFGLVLAVLLPTVVVPGSKKIPLDLNITLHSTGTAKLLDPATNQLRARDQFRASNQFRVFDIFPEFEARIARIYMDVEIVATPER